MSSLVNFGDVPECGVWNRKQIRNRFSALKTCELDSGSYEDYDLDPSFNEELLWCIENMTHEEGLFWEKEQLMALPPREPCSETLMVPQVQDFTRESSDSLLTEASEATENWDLCETSSVSSSWLDVQEEHTSLHVIESEDVVLVDKGPSKVSTDAARPASFAEILQQSKSTGSLVAPRPVKPNWVASDCQPLKIPWTVPEHQAVLENWVVYKSQRFSNGRSQKFQRKFKR
eukprot:gnl/MRDRNA2_/MRDRNA2_91016_c0_seq1.p1 gnl/MRDRNA2_/MRDRNA2_91016_c0~~gnl/MRDRNA2_/MRDRNA2_91016_c0_seq1.p1  ORF type:complete len:262 (-),score=51.55 gnl/MRDRNA2_/MRDRNA2_91016_c0_seq1:106-798(-)